MESDLVRGVTAVVLTVCMFWIGKCVINGQTTYSWKQIVLLACIFAIWAGSVSGFVYGGFWLNALKSAAVGFVGAFFPLVLIHLQIRYLNRKKDKN
jgi:hypothetical protein